MNKTEKLHVCILKGGGRFDGCRIPKQSSDWPEFINLGHEADKTMRFLYRRVFEEKTNLVRYVFDRRYNDVNI